MGNHFFEKMAGIFGGRNESDLFSEKGEAPPIGRAAGQEAGQEAGQAAGCVPIHLFSIGKYFHRSLPPESNINPKIII